MISYYYTYSLVNPRLHAFKMYRFQKKWFIFNRFQPLNFPVIQSHFLRMISIYRKMNICVHLWKNLLFMNFSWIFHEQTWNWLQPTFLGQVQFTTYLRFLIFSIKYLFLHSSIIIVYTHVKLNAKLLPVWLPNSPQYVPSLIHCNSYWIIVDRMHSSFTYYNLFSALIWVAQNLLHKVNPAYSNDI